MSIPDNIYFKDYRKNRLLAIVMTRSESTLDNLLKIAL